MNYTMKGSTFYGKGNSSPIKQTDDKYTITWSDKEAEKKHNEKIKKEEEEKKKKQEKIDAQIEGTYVETEEDIKKRKDEWSKSTPRKK